MYVKLNRWAWWPPWWWQQLLMEWELGRCHTRWWERSSLQSTEPWVPAWLRLSGGSLQPLQPSFVLISHPRSVTVFALVKAIPHVILHLGLPSIFFFHGGVCALAALFAWRFVPETRGKTLSQLCSIYEAKKTKEEAHTPSLWFKDRQCKDIQIFQYIFVLKVKFCTDLVSLNLMWNNKYLTSGLLTR